MPTTKQIEAGRYLNRMGYMVNDNELHYVTDDGSRFVCYLAGDTVETVKELEAAQWPTREGEIPCSECGDFQTRLGGLCPRCQANYHNVE